MMTLLLLLGSIRRQFNNRGFELSVPEYFRSESVLGFMHYSKKL